MADSSRDPLAEQVKQLEAERDDLLTRLAMYESLQVRQGHQSLDVPDELLIGYLLLEGDERKFTTIALSEHQEFVLVWYRYLNLLQDAILGEGSPKDKTDWSVADQLAIRLIAVASGTCKVVLDAGLAGYYAPAFALVRHLFETWFRLEYINMKPDEAARWFVGSVFPPPNEAKVHNFVESNAKGGLKITATNIKVRLKDLNKMAHPSEQSLEQTVGISASAFAFGANYKPHLAASVLHDGATAFRLILQALHHFFPQPETWHQTLQRVAYAHERVRHREHERQSEGKR